MLVYYQKYALNVQVLRSVITIGQNVLIFKSISSHTVSHPVFIYII